MAASVVMSITKTFAELSAVEIEQIESISMADGMMLEMMYNLKNGFIKEPSKIRISMTYESLERVNLIAWMLMDCAAEYNETLVDGCSIHFYTLAKYRNLGLARALMEDNAQFLQEQKSVVAYVLNFQGMVLDFYKRLESRSKVKILINVPHLYMKRNYNVVNG